MFKPGDQIVYIPTHATGDQNHPDREYGFVTSVKPDHGIAFCRYWSRYSLTLLRTKSCSEATPIGNLRIHKSRPQKEVNELITKIEKGEKL
jgi:hypothetical protein